MPIHEPGIRAVACTNRQSVSKLKREDSVRLRSTLDQLLRPKALVLDAGCGTAHLDRILSESHMVLRYAPVLRDFDETADRPFLRKLEDLLAIRMASR